MIENKEHKLIFQISDMLKAESYSVGDRLPSERKMSEMFKASRNTVRSAFRTIAATGAIEVKRSSGYYLVSKSSLEDLYQYNNEDDDKLRISEQLEAFFLFEPTAVVMATERMDAIELKKLEDCVVRMSNAILENDIQKIVDSHRSFHQIIAAGTGNRSINLMLERLEITYVLVSNVMHKISLEERNNIFARHVNLFKAINSGDAETARKMSLQMILSTSLLLKKFEDIPMPKIIGDTIDEQILEMKKKSLGNENEW